MRRGSGFVGGLVDWLTGGLSARLEFLERDVDTLQRDSRELSQRQEGMTRVLADHHQKLQRQADHMVALRKMHAMLSEKLGQPFPGKPCPVCGAPMLFGREAAEKSYALTCSAGCRERLLLPEASLLQTLSSDSAGM